MDTIYIEEEIKNHPRVEKILARFKKDTQIIYCKHYGEVFNAKAQNFRLQKQKPALILAQKKNQLVLKTPEGFGIGGVKNYYFSHMLNCLYDCRYCFLQGMYHSANYVMFINYEDFMHDIRQLAVDNQEPSYFFSGYDSDSLVFEDISGFVESFLPFFAKLPMATLELRTKNINIKRLLAQPAVNNVVVAFSFTPQLISQQIEHGVPSVTKRINAMQQLAAHGYTIGLRFDPLIYHSEYRQLYEELIDSIFENIPLRQIHSATVGMLRFPTAMYQKLVKLYPEDKLLAHPLEKRANHYTYKQSLENEMKMHVNECLMKYINLEKVFSCEF